MKTYFCSPVAIAVAACFFSAAAQAGVAVNATDCSVCTAAQLEALVPNCEQGSRLISDFEAGRLYQGCYDIKGVQRRVVTRSGPVPMTSKIYHWTQPPAYMQNTFQAYLNVYNNNGHVRSQSATAYVHLDLVPKIHLGDDGYMNAYDAVYAPVNNDAVLDWLNTTTFTTSNTSAAPGHAPFSPALAAAVNQLMNAIKSAVVSFDYPLQITVVFHDGSMRTYKVDPSGDWHEVPNAAKDGHGNPIPEKYDDVADGGKKTYGFGGGGPGYDQTNFVHTITGFGIAIQGDSGATYGCTWNGSNNTLTCTRSK
jgi:hypothetical protein